MTSQTDDKPPRQGGALASVSLVLVLLLIAVAAVGAAGVLL
jgi:hypothetical protein